MGNLRSKLHTRASSKLWVHLSKSRYTYIFVVVLLLGVFLRLYRFLEVPGGLNQDEASIGYEAWSILHYGIDRNGIRMPLHLIAWGSGQNVLYAYLSMPFVALFGLNVFSVRMVNLIFGLLSVLLTYGVLRKTVTQRCALIGMALAAIAPWGVMMSRWGLESNLFPCLFLLGFYLFLQGIDREKLLLLAAAVFGLCLYAYGAAYLSVPIFCILAMIYLLKKTKVHFRWILISIIIFVFLAVPMLLFVLTNFYHWGNIQIFGFTIPEMTGISRLTTVTQGHSFLSIVENFKNNVILQQDDTGFNYIAGYGTVFLISLPFTAMGCVSLFRMRKKGDGRLSCLLAIWLISAVILFLCYTWTNINRVNLLWPAMILLTAVGIDAFCKDRKALVAAVICYLILLVGFCCDYFGDYAESVSTQFFASFGEAIEAAEDAADEEEVIYVTENVNMPYIYVLFYTETPPDTYLQTARFRDADVEFQQIVTFGRYVFETQPPLSRQAPGVYILDNWNLQNCPSNAEVIAEFTNYSVVRIS